MQAQKHISYCFAIRSEMVFRHSCPGTYPSDKELIQIPKVDVEKLKRHPSNTSLSSHDSGVAFSKADYEIQRAIKAQRVQRPHIIVLHKGKPIARTNNNDNYNNNNNNSNNNNNLYNHDEFEANIVVAAATASKRNRREIAVVQKRQTMISIGDNYPLTRQLSLIKNNSAPNLHHSNTITKIANDENKENDENMEIDENKENVEIKPQMLNKSLKSKNKLFKSVSLSIRRLVGNNNKEKKRKSRIIQQIHEQPKFF